MSLLSGLCSQSSTGTPRLAYLCAGCFRLSQKFLSCHLRTVNGEWSFLQNKNVLKSPLGLLKHYSTSSRYTVHKLSSRGVFKVEGKDAGDFLQGLITNTMKHVDAPKSAMYSMILNVQGRVMYDLVIYNISNLSDQPCYLLECDGTMTDSIMKDIRKYKLRKKVAMSNVTENFSLLAVLPLDSNGVQELSVPDSDCVIFTPDPRVNQFGWRLLTSADQNYPGTELGEVMSEEGYHTRRYQWGISEGCIDLPPGNCFPLESNLVYLNGACFEKGCYIGQELTARTYHTGVTRKRLMPIEFDRVPDNLNPGADIRTDDDRPAGKYRNSIGKYGLGLMRLSEITKKLLIKTEDNQTYYVRASRPAWWPSEAEEGSAVN